MHSTLKGALASAAMPLAQWVVRHAPPGRVRDAVWRWGKWRSKDFVTRTAHGLSVGGNTLDLIQGYLYWFGVWEPNLTHFVIERMTDSTARLFVDVGANIGYFSILAAKHNPSGGVIAIEAFPPTFAKLQSNIRRNALHNIRALALAASDRPGTVELYYAGNVNEGATTTLPGKFKSAPISVQASPLSLLLTDQEFRAVRLMKIDVEGAESSVIRGLQPKLHLLAGDAEVVVEISANSKGNAQFIFDAFLSQGFHAYALENDYDPRAYLHPKAIQRPCRVLRPLSTHTDVVFSRMRGDRL